MDLIISIGIETLIFALAALGLAVIYGVVGVINLGHGAMLTLGAYCCWWGVQLGLPFPVCVVLAAIVVAVVGGIFEEVVIKHFYQRPFDTLLLTWGFFMIVSEVVKLLFGSGLKGIDSPLVGALSIGGVDIPEYRGLLALIALFLLLATAFVLFKTSYGLKVRALVQNKDTAQLLGLNMARTYKSAFMLGSLLAGLSGALLAPTLAIQPYVGNIYLVRSFFVVLVGGVGRVLAGTLGGSFIIGGVETLLGHMSNQVVANVGVLVLAILLLRFRPSGLFK